LYPEHKATKKTFSKINFNSETEMVFEKIVALSDLDIVNHVNNVKYLEWCLDFIDVELILNQKIKSFEMNFLKELSLKDKVVIHENLTSDAMIFSITKDDKTCFALQLNLE
jgi:acyl-ACP thioesterase